MKRRLTPRTIVSLCMFIWATSVAQALTRLPTPPLADRVATAEIVFVGTLINRVEDGDWVRADLRVDTPIHNAKAGQNIPVVWRRTVNQQVIYNADADQRGIAILKDKHEDRYWLRADKYEPITKLPEIQQLVAAKSSSTKKAAPPTYEQWLADGKKIPPGRMFTGGSPWFNESTGTRRTPQEVYAMLYGNPAASDTPKKGRKPQKNGRFPSHWGQPPRAQTRDLRPLPGGYGRGSSTLAKWIQDNLDKDAKDPDRIKGK